MLKAENHTAVCRCANVRFPIDCQREVFISARRAHIAMTPPNIFLK